MFNPEDVRYAVAAFLSETNLLTFSCQGLNLDPSVFILIERKQLVFFMEAYMAYLHLIISCVIGVQIQFNWENCSILPMWGYLNTETAASYKAIDSLRAHKSLPDLLK